MTEVPLALPRVGVFNNQEPYIPYPAAAEKGMVNPYELARPLDAPLGDEIMSGHVPNNRAAGCVLLNNGDVIVIDHAAVKYEGERVIVGPTAKSDVTYDGQVKAEGANVLVNVKRQTIKLSAFILAMNQNDLRLDALRRQYPVGITENGLAIVANPFGIEYEIDDVDGTSLLVTAKPRIRYY